MKVRFTPSAARELDEIPTYIHEESPQGARKVQARIQHIVALIAKVPLMGRPTRKRSDIRRINTNPYPYVIFYAVTDTEIVIRRIRHMARKPG